MCMEWTSPVLNRELEGNDRTKEDNGNDDAISTEDKTRDNRDSQSSANRREEVV